MALLRAQHVGALQNISPNTKISRTSSTNKQVRFIPVARFTSSSTVRPKYKPVYAMEENTYHQLLAVDPVAFHQLGIDAALAPPSPNMSLRRDSGTRTSTPVTPPLTMLEGRELITIDETGATHAISSPHTPITKTYKGSPLDKELPPKPILRSRDSPERRGLIDTIDNDIMSLDTPVLEPNYSSDGESVNSFKKTSSLSSPSTIGEVETGVAVVVHGETFDMISGKESGKAKRVMAVPVPSRTGSPMMRVRGLHRMTSNGSISSLDRRAARCSVGPILRKTADCHDIIMGPSPHPPRTSSLPKGVNSTVQVSATSRLGRPTRASAAREAESKKNLLNPGKILFTKATASKVSLLSTEKPSASKIAFSSAEKSIVSKKSSEKAGSRLSGSKTSLPLSTTSSSFKKAGKGLKSRFSGMFTRRRNTTIAEDNKGYSSISDDEDDDADVATPTPAVHAKRAPAKFTNTNRNGGMNHKTTPENVRRNKTSKGEMTEKDTAPREQREREQQRVETEGAREAAGNGMPTGFHPVRRNAIVGRGDDGPPTPPPSAGGPGGDHYAENAGATAAPRRPEEYMTELEFDTYLADTLNNAQTALTNAIARVNSVGADGNVLVRINASLAAMGNSIINTRVALMTAIELRATIASLTEVTALQVQFAASAVIDAVEARANSARTDVNGGEEDGCTAGV